jgi:hypothetical protein
LKLTTIISAENPAIIENFQITMERVIEEDELSDFIESGIYYFILFVIIISSK